MRFLLIEKVSPIVAQALRDLGHDVSMASERPGASDTDVLVTARGEDRILVTCDKGFGALVHRDRVKHAGVVVLRLRLDTPDYQWSFAHFGAEVGAGGRHGHRCSPGQ